MIMSKLKNNKLMRKQNHYLILKDGEYPYSITEIFENNEFNTKKLLTLYYAETNYV